MKIKRPNLKSLNIFKKRFLVIIPTHNHPETLEFAIKSVLMQSYENFKLAIICDGVNTKTKKVLESFYDNKKIVVFDFPKSKRVGEEYRDLVIKKFNVDFITYLGDDDLFLPNHLLEMNQALKNHDFVHPIPIFVNKQKEIQFFANADISKKEWIDWHLQIPYQNSISLTGATHSKRSYLSLPVGWSETPADRWPDHFMWEKFFKASNLRFKTIFISTTIKSPQILFSPAERREHVFYFFTRLSDPNFIEEWHSMIKNIAN